MPSTEYAIEDVPLSDPIFHSMLEVKKIPQVTGIGFWRAVGGRTTSERGAESAVAHLRAIRDKHGRIIVVMTHNTDVSNSWERETEDAAYFYQFSIDGYALGDQRPSLRDDALRKHGTDMSECTWVGRLRAAAGLTEDRIGTRS